MAYEFEIRSAIIVIRDMGEFLFSLHRIAGDYATTIICFDSDLLAGKRHAETAIQHALRSFYDGAHIANSLEMEALLYACGSRQCNSAARFGIHEGENRSYICCCPPRKGIWDALLPMMRFVDNNWETLDSEKRSRLKSLFSIYDDEINTVGEAQLSRLILERVALLDAYR